MKCKHENTIHFHIDKYMVDVELCLGCGMSRSEWEQGESEWITESLGLAAYIQQQAEEIREAEKLTEEVVFDMTADIHELQAENQRQKEAFGDNLKEFVHNLYECRYEPDKVLCIIERANHELKQAMLNKQKESK